MKPSVSPPRPVAGLPIQCHGEVGGEMMVFWLMVGALPDQPQADEAAETCVLRLMPGAFPAQPQAAVGGVM